MPEIERVPTYDLGRINQWRNKLYAKLYAKDFLGQIIDEGLFTDLVKLVMKLMKIESEFAVRQTLMEFVGQEITGRTAGLIGLRLAGALNLLRDGKPAIGQISEPSWLPVEISELRYGRVKRSKTYVNMTAMIMGGVMAGHELQKEFSYKMAVWTVANALAWNMRDPRPVHNEMVKMWFMGLLIPDGKKIDIEQFKCVPHQRKWNRELRKSRATPCIRRYRQRCHTCPLGYLDCCRGTHRYTLTFKVCKACKRENALFDPEQPGVGVCIACQTKDARAHWARERMSLS